MAKTPEQILGNHRQHAERSRNGLHFAISSGNPELAALNLRQLFQAYLMQGLISWRHSITSPEAAFREAVHQFAEGTKLLTAMSASDWTNDVPVELVGIIGFLVDIPTPKFTMSEFTLDRLADAVLSNGLRGDWEESAWSRVMEDLQKINRTTLAADSYSTYGRLLHSDPSGAYSLVELGSRLFAKRARDNYYSGGRQIDGGGPDNANTVDFRLAAVMKKIGYAGDTLHRWRWSLASSEEDA